jgi:hypothetical protein
LRFHPDFLRDIEAHLGAVEVQPELFDPDSLLPEVACA